MKLRACGYAVFSYFCAKCLERATKPKCGEATSGSLGTWRCATHGPCVVIRRKEKEPE